MAEFRPPGLDRLRDRGAMARCLANLSTARRLRFGAWPVIQPILPMPTWVNRRSRPRVYGRVRGRPILGGLINQYEPRPGGGDMTDDGVRAAARSVRRFLPGGHP